MPSPFLVSTQDQLAAFRDESDSGVAFVHVDTCLGCYLQDHHNRDGECLFGVYVDGSMTRGAVRAGLVDEVRQTGDRVPDYVTEEMIDKAIDALFDCDLAPIFASSLDAPPREEDFETEEAFDEAEAAWQEELDGSESCQAWFVLTWPVQEDDAT